jgi:hypothetical protein
MPLGTLGLRLFLCINRQLVARPAAQNRSGADLKSFEGGTVGPHVYPIFVMVEDH